MTDTDELRAWIGRSETHEDIVSAGALARMAALLDREPSEWRAGTPVPELWHWAYCLPSERQSGLGIDGHPARGGFLPPTSFPRRMWAGSKLQFLRPLLSGAAIARHSSIANVVRKEGRTGPLVFVTVQHELRDAQGVLITEQQDIVYREAPRPGETGSAAASPEQPQWRRTIEPTETLLFRYSALTFNSHRIHYDRPYAKEQEGYAGLVVHGPLIATLLVDLVHREMPGARLGRFEFRGVGPLLDTAPFDVCGRRREDGAISLWAQDREGRLATQACAWLA